MSNSTVQFSSVVIRPLQKHNRDKIVSRVSKSIDLYAIRAFGFFLASSDRRLRSLPYLSVSLAQRRV